MSETTQRVSCPHGESCGACALLGRDYSRQLADKQRVLEQALRLPATLKHVKLLDCIPSPQIRSYRNRAKLAVALSRSAETRLGYFRAGTREVVDAFDCRVLLPQLLETTRRLRSFLIKARIPRVLRYVDLRCGSDARRQHLTLVFRAKEMPSFPLDALRRACPALDGISINLNPSSGPQVIRGAIKHIWGRREIWVDHVDLRLRVSPGAFFQVNLEILPAIHTRMEAFLGTGTALADLYAGVGTHGLALRRNFRRLLFIEGTRSTVADLKSTMSRYQIGHAEVVARSVERALEPIEKLAPQAAILNPSRAGAEEAVLRTLAATPVKRLAYLSCEPKTLCRDLDLLVQLGFAVHSVQPIDMMPQTKQVEALALIERRRDAPQRRPAPPKRKSGTDLFSRRKKRK